MDPNGSTVQAHLHTPYHESHEPHNEPHDTLIVKLQNFCVVGGAIVFRQLLKGGGGSGSGARARARSVRLG